MNYFSLMLRKRLKKDEDLEGEEEGEVKQKKGGRKSKGLLQCSNWLYSSPLSIGHCSNFIFRVQDI